jgi:hypothetical protein
VVGALGGIDAALEAAEGVLAADEGLAGRAVFLQGPGVLHFAFEDLGIDSSKAAEQPFIVDEDVDEEAFFGGGGKEALAIFTGEGFKGGGVFAADEVGFGVDAGLESIHAGDGLARNGAWPGGSQGVETIRRDLFDGWHKRKGQAGGLSKFESSMGVGGGADGEICMLLRGWEIGI